MKKYLYLICAIALCAASCNKAAVSPAQDPELTVNFTNTAGYWVLESWQGHDMSETSITLYLKNKEFTLWQSIGSMYPVEYTGTYNLVEVEGKPMMLRGMYDYSYEFWAHNYYVTSLTATHMVLEADDDPENIQIFKKSASKPENVL